MSPSFQVTAASVAAQMQSLGAEAGRIVMRLTRTWWLWVWLPFQINRFSFITGLLIFPTGITSRLFCFGFFNHIVISAGHLKSIFPSIRCSLKSGTYMMPEHTNCSTCSPNLPHMPSSCHWRYSNLLTLFHSCPHLPGMEEWGGEFYLMLLETAGTFSKHLDYIKLGKNN